ncbi:MAG: tRNA (5-methylaminomethyl-2-thiouridine)(34)-methyltransferase MnmD [Hyphomicrobiaceae bacterium]
MTQSIEHSLIWKDGDQPVSNKFDDMFYSPDNGQAETAYVFLGGNGLQKRWDQTTQFVVGELGFGTGLNFLETWRLWKEVRKPGQSLKFVSFECYPMSGDAMARALQPWQSLRPLSASLVARWTMRHDVDGPWQMDEQTALQVIEGNAEHSVGKWKGQADAWYLDGFAPSKNPDMWSEKLMQDVYAHTATSGTFATYTAAGWVRRNLQQAGFVVAKRDGFAGKREMLVGHKAE